GPFGFYTIGGVRGFPLWGGLPPRLGTARAILADPRILILDDATSSVDASTENALKTALRNVMQGRTTFVIAHRASTIALADEIVVLERGRIAAYGTHEELLSSSDLYREIVEKGMPDQVFLTEPEAEAVGL
ncbi:MAG: ABC transporter ATP-binding protein, partial [Solirubrobacteraceae bacterium]